MKFTTAFALLLSTFLLQAQELHLNQVGFKPKSYKTFVVKDLEEYHKYFNILDAKSAKTVYSGEIKATFLWDKSNEKLSVIDFTAFAKEGNYLLQISDRIYRNFTISNNCYENILKASCKAYYLNRASMDIDAQYAGPYARKAGHLDNNVLYHSSAFDANHDENSRLNSPGGWYDAGDYNKYIVNSGISTFTLLRAYEKFQKVHQKLDLNIPESINKQADLLDEIEYNINWMVTMQDSLDGGVYHKLTEKRFSGFLQPIDVTADRFVVMKTTAAALDFCAVMSYYSRITKDEIKKKTFLNYAKKAFEWAEANPKVIYEQPADVNTGTYGDENIDDEWFWARAEMFISTGDDYYANELKDFHIKTEANWAYVKPLGLFVLAANPNRLQNKAQANILEIADHFISIHQASPNATVMGGKKEDFIWGSNAVAANQSMLLIEASFFAKDDKLIIAAWSNIHYILGQNPLNFCYVTGFGTKSPWHIHHRLSSSDKITAPQPGLLAGGPNYAQQDAKEGLNYPTSLPALSYLDEEPSYASNEIAINWNAPLVYILSFAHFAK